MRDLRDISEETPLINLPRDVLGICKSAIFEMSLRRCMRHLKDASEMHPCRLGRFFLLFTRCFLLVTFYSFFVSTYTLLVTTFSFRFTHYSLLFTCYFLLVTCYYLLVTLYFTFHLSLLTRYLILFTHNFCSIIFTIVKFWKLSDVKNLNIR